MSTTRRRDYSVGAGAALGFSISLGLVCWLGQNIDHPTALQFIYAGLIVGGSTLAGGALGHTLFGSRNRQNPEAQQALVQNEALSAAQAAEMSAAYNRV